MSKKIRVLYAEDEQDIRENIVEILLDENFEVFAAENGKMALDMFLEKDFDVIVSDVMMPEMDGHDLLKAIRSNKDSSISNVPFIFLTALGQKEDIVKGIDLKANDYLTKPIDFDLLIAKIKEKYENYRKIKKTHNESISSLKNQVSDVIPSELNKFLKQIIDISKHLRSEPYGPLPHGKYLEDLKRIYMSGLKMNSLIHSFVSGEAIDNQLNSNDIVIKCLDLAEDVKNNVSFDMEINLQDNIADIKVDKKLLSEILSKILAAMLKIDTQLKIEVSAVEDHTGQMVMIFYSGSNKVNNNNIRKIIDFKKVNKYLEPGGYNIDLSFKEDSTSLLLQIPSYKVVK